MSFLDLKKVTKIYPNGTKAVHETSLSVHEGEFMVFVGPSGCGKSTLLRMVAGLEDITDGDINLDGKLINDVDPSERDVAMVFQNYALYPHMNVYNNLAYGLKNRGIDKKTIEQKVNDAAKLLQISEFLKRKPSMLSGGQRQRVAIGRAITRKPKVFLFDEPLSNLDAALRVQMRIELAKLHDHLDATMVYVTHDQTEAMTLSDEIVVLDQGEISQQGRPIELYNNPKNLFVAGFIGSPKMNFINAKISSIDQNKVEINVLGSKITISKKINSNENSDIIFGIRPEDIIITDGSDYDFQGKAFVVEKLGSNTFIYLDNEGDPIVVEASGDSLIKVGDDVKIKFDLNKTNLFNSSNKIRID